MYDQEFAFGVTEPGHALTIAVFDDISDLVRPLLNLKEKRTEFSTIQANGFVFPLFSKRCETKLFECIQCFDESLSKALFLLPPLDCVPLNLLWLGRKLKRAVHFL